MKAFNKKKKPKHTTKVKYLSDSVYCYPVWCIRTSKTIVFNEYFYVTCTEKRYQRDSL